MARKPAPVTEAPEAVAAPAPTVLWFESANNEPVSFDVMGIRPIRNFSNGRLEWEVRAADADRFKANHFVIMGRVRPKG